MTTIQDVAKKAQVSTATVSRVLNNHSYVAAATRLVVEKAIKELDYKPNMLGRNLRRSSTKMILVFLPTISNAFYTKVLEGIEDTARINKYYILLCETNNNPEIQRFYLNLAKESLVDGIISLDPTVEQIIVENLNNRIPVIQCGEKTSNKHIPYVGIDNVAAAYKAVKYLISIGHSKISLISSSEDFRYARDRRKGYEKALKEADIPINPNFIQYSELDFEDGYRTMINIIDQDDRPTAVFTVGDMIAIGALKAIKDSGLDSPRDIAVIGFDNIPFAKMMNPSLTTVAQPLYEMGTHAVHMFLEKLEDNTITLKPIILQHELIIRESTMN